MPTATNDETPMGAYTVQVPGSTTFDVAQRVGFDGEVHLMAAPDITFTISDGPGDDDQGSDVLISLPKLLRGLSMSIELGKELSGEPLTEAGLAMAVNALCTTQNILCDSVSPGLQSELARLVGPLETGPRSQIELRIVSSQMVGWGTSLLECSQQAVAAQVRALSESA
jgi:hypothetical protein